MHRTTATALLIVTFAWCMSRPCTGSDSDDDGRKHDAPRIALVALQANEERLDLRYEVANKSMDDIWICTDMMVQGRWHFEVMLGTDGRTLVVRRRLDVATEYVPTVGLGGVLRRHHLLKYVRLKPSERRSESLSFELPIQGQRILSLAQPTDNTVYIDRLVLQVGFYTGSLPSTIRRILEDAERASEAYSGSSFVPLSSLPSGGMDVMSLYQLNSANKTLSDVTDEVMVPYASRRFISEDLLQISVDGLHIPYKETTDSSEINTGSCLIGVGSRSDVTLLRDRHGANRIQ